MGMLPLFCVGVAIAAALAELERPRGLAAFLVGVVVVLYVFGTVGVRVLVALGY